MNPFAVVNWRLIYQPNGHDCGGIYKEVDGYYVWYPNEDQGFWQGPMLVAIGELLNSMNAEWDAEVRRGLESLD